MRKLLPKVMLGMTAVALAWSASVMGLKAQAPAKTVWSGVFSADQATQGKTVFDNKCAICHGAEMNGGEMAPPLAGASFVANWSGQTLGDLFTRIHSTMPANDPGSMNNAETTLVLAYILSFNQFPAGAAPLPSDEAALGQIGITDKK
ncbi:MAG TPA: cytochrome c [Rhizomicrobium sp.]|nr:cytochrome c [Rhizomicrobium sp.]